MASKRSARFLAANIDTPMPVLAVSPVTKPTGVVKKSKKHTRVPRGAKRAAATDKDKEGRDAHDAKMDDMSAATEGTEVLPLRRASSTRPTLPTLYCM
tara:strand:+ start:477 stop:770 length:294 start_codon:yes stop_codon:yes gene_type:complete